MCSALLPRAGKISEQFVAFRNVSGQQMIDCVRDRDWKGGVEKHNKFAIEPIAYKTKEALITKYFPRYKGQFSSEQRKKQKAALKKTFTKFLGRKARFVKSCQKLEQSGQEGEPKGDGFSNLYKVKFKKILFRSKRNTARSATVSGRDRGRSRSRLFVADPRSKTTSDLEKLRRSLKKTEKRQQKRFLRAEKRRNKKEETKKMQQLQETESGRNDEEVGVAQFQDHGKQRKSSENVEETAPVADAMKSAVKSEDRKKNTSSKIRNKRTRFGKNKKKNIKKKKQFHRAAGGQASSSRSVGAHLRHTLFLRDLVITRTGEEDEDAVAAAPRESLSAEDIFKPIVTSSTSTKEEKLQAHISKQFKRIKEIGVPNFFPANRFAPQVGEIRDYEMGAMFLNQDWKKLLLCLCEVVGRTEKEFRLERALKADEVMEAARQLHAMKVEKDESKKDGDRPGDLHVKSVKKDNVDEAKSSSSANDIDLGFLSSWMDRSTRKRLACGLQKLLAMHTKEQGEASKKIPVKKKIAREIAAKKEKLELKMREELQTLLLQQDKVFLEDRLKHLKVKARKGGLRKKKKRVVVVRTAEEPADPRRRRGGQRGGSRKAKIAEPLVPMSPIIEEEGVEDTTGPAVVEANGHKGSDKAPAADVVQDTSKEEPAADYTDVVQEETHCGIAQDQDAETGSRSSPERTNAGKDIPGDVEQVESVLAPEQEQEKAVVSQEDQLGEIAQADEQKDEVAAQECVVETPSAEETATACIQEDGPGVPVVDEVHCGGSAEAMQGEQPAPEEEETSDVQADVDEPKDAAEVEDSENVDEDDHKVQGEAGLAFDLHDGTRRSDGKDQDLQNQVAALETPAVDEDEAPRAAGDERQDERQDGAHCRKVSEDELGPVSAAAGELQTSAPKIMIKTETFPHPLMRKMRCKSQMFNCNCRERTTKSRNNVQLEQL
ncbi:unnamed protein product [Amoebophrya sp. A120]|nr:unnamed protein product [Amoebophrya sp. A120]|eukprot:GSA120T00003256001.1